MEQLRIMEGSRVPAEEYFETPTHEVVTAIGRITCDWANTTLKRYEDVSYNHIEYNDGDTLHKLNVLNDDWETLSELKFPWDYYPEMSRFDDNDLIDVSTNSDSYQFRPRDTRLMLFDDSRYNHVEHRTEPNRVRGITVVPALWRMMFKGDYPIRYLPYVDRATLEFFDNIRRA